MIIRSKTFENWMKANLKDYMQDLATHGAAAGFPGLTYYTDTAKLYAKFKDEIWDVLVQDAEDMGYSNVWELIASFGGSDIGNATQMENLLVWYMAERIAQDYMREHDPDW